MRLSEAIRLGAMLKPQGFGFYQTYGGSCAYGAAMDACGIADDRQNYVDDRTITALFPISAVAAVCPLCGAFAQHSDGADVTDVDGVVIHLNDDHHQTREQIADWVASVERADERRASPASEAAVDPVEGLVAG